MFSIASARRPLTPVEEESPRTLQPIGRLSSPTSGVWSRADYVRDDVGQALLDRLLNEQGLRVDRGTN